MKVTDSPSVFVGILGLGLIQVVGLYETSAPSLKELRQLPEGDITGEQALMDADLMIGSIVLIVSITAATVLDSFWPILFLFGGFLTVAGWHHLVLHSPN